MLATPDALLTGQSIRFSSKSLNRISAQVAKLDADIRLYEGICRFVVPTEEPVNSNNIAFGATRRSGKSRSENDSRSHNSIIFQLDLGLKAPPREPAGIRAGWAVELHSSGQRYIIQNLDFGYRIAPPLFGDEVGRALRILGEASKHRTADSANEVVDLAWDYIAGGVS